jgi:hypothetical protein
MTCIRVGSRYLRGGPRDPPKQLYVKPCSAGLERVNDRNISESSMFQDPRLNRHATRDDTARVHPVAREFAFRIELSLA